jgi:hypothetical protein
MSDINTTEIGVGTLNWNRGERIGDRYGAVGLWPGDESSIEVEYSLPLNLPPEGKRGRLVAHVLATRESGHIGDLMRGLYPQTPEVGEIILLGEGTVFWEADKDGRRIGLRPDDGRDHDWLDPEALYRAHDQTVRLLFEEVE